jgi:hypothetical protein
VGFASNHGDHGRLPFTIEPLDILDLLAETELEFLQSKKSLRLSGAGRACSRSIRASITAWRFRSEFKNGSILYLQVDHKADLVIAV